MKVLFYEDVKNVANAGEVKNVKDGFARNYLLKKNLAVEATKSNIEKLEKIQDRILEKEKSLIEKTEKLSSDIEKISIVLTRKAGEKGKLYGAITSQEIAEELNKKGLDIDKKQIALKLPIKEIGEHKITINLAKGLKGHFSLEVKADVDEEGDY